MPVLVDGDTTVSDSWEIACYLEKAYPAAPSLFGGEAGEGAARLVAAYVDSQIHPLVARCVVADIPKVIHADDQAYFRESREKRFGMTLEAIVANHEETKAQLKTTLYPVRTALKDRPFLGGSTPSFADYAVFGAFMWARGVSDFKILESDDPVAGWRERMLDLYDGMPRREPGYPV